MARLVRTYLERDGFEVTLAFDGPLVGLSAGADDDVTKPFNPRSWWPGSA